ALQTQHPEIPAFPATDGTVKIPAAWLIEQCGFKGARDGKVGISDKHALVLVNHGGTATEILAFAAEIQQTVQSRYGLALHIEPTVLGDD
ncbi:MAG: UDP-N-acetylmuramate dehydrogenase, partial [Cardiobacterium sp.]